MSTDFFLTVMGRQFYEGTMPRIAKSLETIAAKLSATNTDELEQLRKERDAYKKAKQENDERFMNERDAASAEVERLSSEVAELIHYRDKWRQEALDWRNRALAAEEQQTRLSRLLAATEVPCRSDGDEPPKP